MKIIIQKLLYNITYFKIVQVVKTFHTFNSFNRIDFKVRHNIPYLSKCIIISSIHKNIVMCKTYLIYAQQHDGIVQMYIDI